MEKITERQKNILQCIQNHMKEEGFPPTVRELAKEIGNISSTTIYAELEVLEEKQYIKKDFGKKRNIRLIQNIPDEKNRVIPLVKKLVNTKYLFVGDNIEKYAHFPFPMKEKKLYFACAMTGNFLCERGIYDGDTLYFEIVDQVSDGTIVAALADGNDVKGIFSEGKIYPANSEMHPIEPDKIRIIGKLIGITREY